MTKTVYALPPYKQLNGPRKQMVIVLFMIMIDCVSHYFHYHTLYVRQHWLHPIL